MMPEEARFVLAALIATIIAVRGRRRKSLSPSGAVAAFFVGLFSFSSSIRFGMTMLSFYVSATRATRYKANYKREHEDGYTEAGGNRNAAQVLASSLPAVLIGLVYFTMYKYDAPIMRTFPMRSSLLLAYMLFFAACAGDTFASEIGIAMPGPGKRPVLITAPWRFVPRGTNGGVTWEGTLASAVGGLVIGATYFATGPEISLSQLWLIPVGIFGGVFGSAVDSVLGAVLQSSWLDRDTGNVLREMPEKLRDGRHEHICGYDLVSGELVNVAAAVITSGTAGGLLKMFG